MPPELQPRAALYVRVSTNDQTTQNQERELRRWADPLGLELVAVYQETASGARPERAALAKVLAAANAGSSTSRACGRSIGSRVRALARWPDTSSSYRQPASA